jgi:uncharacterized oxidoreductase
MRLAIERARKGLGSCIMALAHAHHLGRIGHFAEMAVAQGLVSIHFVNVLSRPVVAPFQGGDGRFGTNPCCIGVPLPGQDPFVLDFATSRVAQGKMRVAHNEGRQVEPGTLIDEDGRPTTDPGVVVVQQPRGGFGALMPFGEHKGFGMAIACELLGGALTGSGTWHRPADSARAVLNGMFAMLVDPVKLGTADAFAQEALAFVDWLRQSPPAPGTDGVLLAGEPERAARAERAKQGITIDDTTWGEIEAAGRKVGEGAVFLYPIRQLRALTADLRQAQLPQLVAVVGEVVAGSDGEPARAAPAPGGQALDQQRRQFGAVAFFSHGQRDPARGGRGDGVHHAGRLARRHAAVQHRAHDLPAAAAVAVELDGVQALLPRQRVGQLCGAHRHTQHTPGLGPVRHEAVEHHGLVGAVESAQAQVHNADAGRISVKKGNGNAAFGQGGQGRGSEFLHGAILGRAAAGFCSGKPQCQELVYH